ncbi:MAG: HAMP domain-containing histidine kinase, partial [Candidatus Aminicenantes bacterium]|nr:HAMP domain-containing histidine kinase [Candidatus Aminicenantes bacterium]
LAWGECLENIPPAWGDPASLEQVFSNLLHNAIVYNRPGGRVEVGLGEADEAVLVTIRDTGIGIAAKDLPFIFDEFYRVSRGEGARSKGSGLGLPIAKKIVEAHGGRVDVASVLGEGTTFTVRLPKAEASGPSP